jgi:hypothetical protein
MNEDIQIYHQDLPAERKEICDKLFEIIGKNLTYAESKLWHGHPVWFIEGNPIVGYSSLKSGIQLMFWSGASFDEPRLAPGSGKFKDASVIYTDVKEVVTEDIVRWLALSKEIQWDYKNIVQRKGELRRLK